MSDIYKCVCGQCKCVTAFINYVGCLIHIFLSLSLSPPQSTFAKIRNERVCVRVKVENRGKIRKKEKKERKKDDRKPFECRDAR